MLIDDVLRADFVPIEIQLTLEIIAGRPAKSLELEPILGNQLLRPWARQRCFFGHKH